MMAIATRKEELEERRDRGELTKLEAGELRALGGDPAETEEDAERTRKLEAGRQRAREEARPTLGALHKQAAEESADDALREWRES
jgi:hypothetical protein